MNRTIWIGFVALAILAFGGQLRAEGVGYLARLSDGSEDAPAAVGEAKKTLCGECNGSGNCRTGCRSNCLTNCRTDGGLTFVPMMIGADSPNVPRMGNLSFLHQSMVRVADNHSPLPTDRVGVSYHMFHDAPLSGNLAPPDGTLHEFELLLEKQLFSGTMSVEFIVPIADTVSSTQDWTTALATVDKANELGNLGLNLKCLVWQRANAAISGGLLVEAPTSDDLTITVPFGTETLHTDTWYLTPYLATLITPTERLYFQAFTSFRATTRANDLEMNAVNVGQLRDQDLLMADGGVGYWLHRDTCARWLTGLAPTVEVHYMTTVTDGEGASGALNPRADYLNLTAGATAVIRDRSTLGLACVVPLRTGESPLIGHTDRLFDWQLAVQFNLLW